MQEDGNPWDCAEPGDCAPVVEVIKTPQQEFQAACESVLYALQHVALNGARVEFWRDQAYLSHAKLLAVREQHPEVRFVRKPTPHEVLLQAIFG